MWAEKLYHKSDDEAVHPPSIIISVRGGGYGVQNNRELEDVVLHVLPDVNKMQKTTFLPEVKFVKRMLGDTRGAILLVMEATGKFDLGVTVDQYTRMVIEEIRFGLRQRILPIVMIDPVHSHAYAQNCNHIVNQSGPVNLNIKMKSLLVPTIFSPSEEFPAELEKLLRSRL